MNQSSTKRRPDRQTAKCSQSVWRGPRRTAPQSPRDSSAQARLPLRCTHAHDTAASGNCRLSDHFSLKCYNKIHIQKNINTTTKKLTSTRAIIFKFLEQISSLSVRELEMLKQKLQYPRIVSSACNVITCFCFKGIVGIIVEVIFRRQELLGEPSLRRVHFKDTPKKENVSLTGAIKYARN